jgi:hypothetical protein
MDSLGILFWLLLMIKFVKFLKVNYYFVIVSIKVIRKKLCFYEVQIILYFKFLIGFIFFLFKFINVACFLVMEMLHVNEYLKYFYLITLKLL